MRKRSIFGLLALVVAVSAMTTASLAVVGVYRIPTGFMTPVTTWDSTSGGQAGGLVFQVLAGSNETLKVGDLTYWKANNSVGKSATLADYNAVAGVIVGGQSLSGSGVANDSASVGTTACAGTGKKCWLLVRGRAWMKTADSVYFGSQLIIGAVAGTVKRRAASLDSLNRIFGKANFTIDSGKKVAVNVNVR